MMGGRVLARRWLFLFVLFLARTVPALQFQAVASAGPFLITALAVDYASLGLLIGLHSLPGVVIAIPGGMIGQKFGTKRVALIGLCLMAMGGIVMGSANHFRQRRLGARCTVLALAEIEAQCRALAQELGLECIFRQ